MKKNRWLFGLSTVVVAIATWVNVQTSLRVLPLSNEVVNTDVSSSSSSSSLLTTVPSVPFHPESSKVHNNHPTETTRTILANHSSNHHHDHHHDQNHHNNPRMTTIQHLSNDDAKGTVKTKKNMNTNTITNTYTNTTIAAAATETTETTEAAATTTKILGFADDLYKEIAVRWYRRLERLGYQEQMIVAVDDNIATYLQRVDPPVRYQRISYPPCTYLQTKDTRKYRRQLFARRWKYLYETLQDGYHVLLTDVDNVFRRYLPMQELEDSPFDVYHAYSTSYPISVYEQMGFTVCGGMGWYRSTPGVMKFVGTLLNHCHCWRLKEVNCKKDCVCDDQVVLNELLAKGKHAVTWTPQEKRPNTTTTSTSTSTSTFPSLKDYPWKPKTGISAKTQHKIYVWDRNVAYRAPMPETCPSNNWVAMPLYVNRSTVVEEWDALCGSNMQTAKG